MSEDEVMTETEDEYESEEEEEESEQHRKNTQFLNYVRHGMIQSIEKSLDHGAEVNCEVGAALIKAVKRNRMDIVDVLLKRGADINIREHGPILNTAITGNFPMLQKLVERGANPRGYHDYALRYALNFLHFEMASFLMDLGSEYRTEWNKDMTDEAIEFACNYKPLGLKAASKTE